MKQVAWLFVGYLIAVILFGAWVRIEGAGAGCGNHWPTCQGVVVPVAPTVKTVIEFTHRVTSGLSGLWGLAMLYLCWRRKQAVGWAVGMVIFLILEGFIGAVLVKKELVANNASMSRAVVISLHLANTLLLMFCAVMVAVGLSGWNRARIPGRRMIWASMGLLVLTSMAGAVTALGDTVFPKTAGAIEPDHFLVRLRIVHPVLAALSGLVIIWVLSKVHSTWSRAGIGIVLLQMCMGVVVILLAAPGWMQLAHLLLAQLLWAVVVIVWAETFDPDPLPAGS